MPGLNSSEKPGKLGGYDFYRDVLGSPKYVVAPMVDQSELAWRTLSRRYGAQMFAEGARKGVREQNFSIAHGEEGAPADRPLIVQFCGHDPAALLASARVVEAHCDAVDVNLGCPQDIARRGHYGAFLQDEWELVYELVNTLHKNLSVPVTAKFRVFSTVEKTVEYAKMLERAGAQILTCHGRIREQRGHKSGLADWAKIRAVKDAVSIPVFANGNVLFHSDIARCLAATGADAVMSAEGNLYNPALFAPAPSPSPSSPPSPALSGLHPRHTALAREYLAIVRAQRTPTSPSAVKGHLFKLLRPALARETDLREQLGRLRVERGRIVWAHADALVAALAERMARDEAAAGATPLEALLALEPSTGLPRLPHWLAQPYFRPLPVEAAADAAAGRHGDENTALQARSHIMSTINAEAEVRAAQPQSK
ncbi:Dus-domain-containing protein [Amylocystis lapponica]|nr:Dus-domain-containing protein [Amylocystis lapponica]